MEKPRPPVLLFVICTLGFMGVIAAGVGQFFGIHPLLEPVGWAVFIGVNILLILNAVFRKKQSDITGEFHAFNFVCWMVTIMVEIAFVIVIGLILTVLTDSNPREDLVYWSSMLALAFALLLSWNWLRWLMKKR